MADEKEHATNAGESVQDGGMKDQEASITTGEKDENTAPVNTTETPVPEAITENNTKPEIQAVDSPAASKEEPIPVEHIEQKDPAQTETANPDTPDTSPEDTKSSTAEEQKEQDTTANQDTPVSAESEQTGTEQHVETTDETTNDPVKPPANSEEPAKATAVEDHSEPTDAKAPPMATDTLPDTEETAKSGTEAIEKEENGATASEKVVEASATPKKEEENNETVSTEVAHAEATETTAADVEATSAEGETEEVHTEAAEKKEIPDYSSSSTEQLVKELKKILQEEAIQTIREHVEVLKNTFFDKIQVLYEEKRAEYLEGGGEETHFVFTHPDKKPFQDLLHEYKTKKSAYHKAVEEGLQSNLNKRLQLIEELKSLIDKEEKMADTFKEFRHIQEEWRNCGQIPKSEISDVWKTYHHHVENFYDYLKLNKELRDLDFKKNLQQKEELCAKAEALVEEPSVHKAFDELQKLHNSWREETGPVAKEEREAIWDRFREATKKIHERRREHFKQIKDQQLENLKIKSEICEQLEAIAAETTDKHEGWQHKIQEIQALEEKFKHTGRVPSSDNNAIWDRFREALRKFNRQKNEFYKSLKDEQKGNLEKKMELVTQAEALKDSEDWKETSQKLKELQAQWKTIGPVSRQVSDKVWKQFRAACNTFFDRLNGQLEENYQKKEAVLKKVESYVLDEANSNAFEELKAFMNEWKELGQVPKAKKEIETNFNKIINSYFEKLKLDKKELGQLKFKNKIERFASQGDIRKIEDEQRFVHKKIQETEKELHQLENNIHFFSQSNQGSNPLIKQVEKNIKKYQRDLEQWKEKSRYLSKLIRTL